MWFSWSVVSLAKLFFRNLVMSVTLFVLSGVKRVPSLVTELHIVSRVSKMGNRETYPNMTGTLMNLLSAYILYV